MRQLSIDLLFHYFGEATPDAQYSPDVILLLLFLMQNQGLQSVEDILLFAAGFFLLVLQVPFRSLQSTREAHQSEGFRRCASYLLN